MVIKAIACSEINGRMCLIFINCFFHYLSNTSYIAFTKKIQAGTCQVLPSFERLNNVTRKDFLYYLCVYGKQIQ